MGKKTKPEGMPTQNVMPAWQCLAASVDVEPATLGMDHFLLLNSALRSLDMATEGDPKWLLDMAKRWRILAKELEKDKALRSDKRRNDVELETELKFDAFLAFAKSKRWALPKALKD